MDVAALIDQLAQDGPLLATAARQAGWDAPVPHLGWDVRTLVTHMGGVHRWAADIVRTGAQHTDTDLGRRVGQGPDDAELLAWFSAGHADLVAALAAAPADLQAATFLPADSPLHFWARRQAHETSVHRVDAQTAVDGGAAYAITPIDADIAQDGIAELLGFARRRAYAIDRPATIGLDAFDGPSWLITLGGPRTEAERSEELAGTDVTIRGASGDLYLWLWNRPSEALADGDQDVAALWAQRVRVGRS